jgi:hypothetical protein
MESDFGIFFFLFHVTGSIFLFYLWSYVVYESRSSRYGGKLVADGEMDPGDVLTVFFTIVIASLGVGQAYAFLVPVLAQPQLQIAPRYNAAVSVRRNSTGSYSRRHIHSHTATATIKKERPLAQQQRRTQPK